MTISLKLSGASHKSRMYLNNQPRKCHYCNADSTTRDHHLFEKCLNCPLYGCRECKYKEMIMGLERGKYYSVKDELYYCSSCFSKDSSRMTYINHRDHKIIKNKKRDQITRSKEILHELDLQLIKLGQPKTTIAGKELLGQSKSTGTPDIDYKALLNPSMFSGPRNMYATCCVCHTVDKENPYQYSIYWDYKGPFIGCLGTFPYCGRFICRKDSCNELLIPIVNQRIGVYDDDDPEREPAQICKFCYDIEEHLSFEYILFSFHFDELGKQDRILSELKEQIKRTEIEILDLKYRPGSIGYKEAEEDFTNRRNSQI